MFDLELSRLPGASTQGQRRRLVTEHLADVLVGKAQRGELRESWELEVELVDVDYQAILNRATQAARLFADSPPGRCHSLVFCA